MRDYAKPKVSIAFDMFGCPQSCRHCWLGQIPWQPMDEQDVFSTFAEARQLEDVHVESIAPDFREPHMAPEYRELYARCDKINGCRLEADYSFELLNLWRLVNDPEYAVWAAARGIRRCQLKWFGTGSVNDDFYGRVGVDQILARATDILLENGIVPRWQIYLNSAGAPQLQDIWQLAQEWELPRRVKQLNDTFDIHCLAYDVDGSAFAERHRRMRRGEEHHIPRGLWESTQRKFAGYELQTEGDLYRQINDGDSGCIPDTGGHQLWFFVTSNWDVYPNFMGPAPWWKLGNLRTEPWQDVWQRYAAGDCIGLQVMRTWTAVQLAQAYGAPDGDSLFDSVGQVVDYWRGHACRDLYRAQQVERVGSGNESTPKPCSKSDIGSMWSRKSQITGFRGSCPADQSHF